MSRRTRVLLGICVCLLGLQGCSSLPRQLAPPRAEVVELRIVQAGFDGQRFAVRVDLFNPNPVPIPVRFVEFNVRLSGEGLLDGRSAAPFTLPAGGTEVIEVEIFSNLVSSATRLLAVVQGPTNTLEYEIQGELTLDVSMREPLGFYHRGQVPLSVAR